MSDYICPGVDDVVALVREREAVRILHDAGAPEPWSADPLFTTYYFCNVHREDDKVTKWLAANWRNRHALDPDLWFAFAVFRRGLNNPVTAELLGYPVPWDPDHYRATYAARYAEGKPWLRSAYMMPCAGYSYKIGPGTLANEQCKILDPVWAAREFIRPKPGDSLQSLYERLLAQKWFSSFYSGQIIADLKYVQLTDAPDWWTFVAPGPGSRRGLNRLLGRKPTAGMTDKEWVAQFRLFETALNQRTRDFGQFHSQDIQNVLCEYDKVCRIRSGVKCNVRKRKKF